MFNSKVNGLLLAVLGVFMGADTVLAAPAPVTETLIYREGGQPSLSGDGQWLAYECNSRKGLCLTDTTTGVTEVLVTVSGILQDVDISRDGKVIAYWLRPGSKGTEQLYVYDRNTSSTELVSVNSAEVPGVLGSTLTISSLYSEPHLSETGRYVIFSSYASNLVANDTNTNEDVFIRDRELGITTRVSVALNGAQGDADSGDWGEPPSISADGLTAVFKSSAENLEPNDIADNAPAYDLRYDDIFMVDTITGVITRISEVVNSAIGGDSHSWLPVLSLDGNVAVFVTRAENLHSGSYSHNDLLLYNRSTGSLTHVNPPAFGSPQSDDMSSRPALNFDGSIIYFQANANNLVLDDVPFTNDVFAYQNGALQIIRPMINGVPTSVYNADTNDLGDVMAFEATISDNGGPSYNGVGIYKRDMTPPLVSQFALIPGGPVVPGALIEVRAFVSDVDRGNTDIQNAEYSIDDGDWVPLSASDGAFDSVSEQVHGYVDTTGLTFGIHTLCMRAQDAGGYMTVKSCQEFEITVLGSANDFMLYCYHTPLWPQPGETVRINVRTYDFPLLDHVSAVIPVDQIEVWFNDKTAPASVVSKSETSPHYLDYTSTVLAQGSFSYGCRAKLGDKAAFTGWRTVAVGAQAPDSPIPVSYTGPSSERIDFVFIADADSYSGATDPDFIRHINEVIRHGFYGLPFYNQYQHMYNFWLASGTGTADREQLEDGSEKKTVTRPTAWDENYTFADAGAIIHTDKFRDFAKDGMFTFEPNQFRTLRHEAGHSAFGLSDEYCCDTGYFENEILPNVYATLASCELDAPALGRVAADCRSWVSGNNDNTYFSSDPASLDLMVDNTLPNAADIRRIEWVFDQCLTGSC